MSKRAEELFAKIARGKPSALTGQWREPYTPQEEIALIDAELRKAVDQAARRVCDVWIDQSKNFDWATVKAAIMAEEEG